MYSHTSSTNHPSRWQTNTMKRKNFYIMLQIFTHQSQSTSIGKIINTNLYENFFKSKFKLKLSKGKTFILKKKLSTLQRWLYSNFLNVDKKKFADNVLFFFLVSFFLNGTFKYDLHKKYFLSTIQIFDHECF